MTKPPSPRIYTYKITFEEVPYYYYGVHKEKKFNEEYWGTPVTHKWIWDFYTPKKQILEFFEYSDEGWLKAQEIEKQLIKPFYNTDEWCLNKNCGGLISLKILKENGKKSGSQAVKFKIGIHGLSPEQRSQNSRRAGKKSGQKIAELKIGVCGRSQEKMTEDGKIGGKITGERHKENGTGIFKLSKEQLIEQGKKRAQMFTKEERSEAGKIGGSKTGSQVWECTVTGHKSTPGGLSRYQKARGIDTSNRIRIS